MNMKKLVISMAVAGIMITPLSHALNLKGLDNNKPNKPTLSQVKIENKRDAKPAGLAVNNLITLEKAYQVVATKTTGRVLSAMLDTEFGAPNYEFIVLEAGKLKQLLIHGETAVVLVDNAIEALPLYNPALDMGQIIASVEQALSATAYAGELQQEENHGAYRLLAGTEQAMYEVIASGETGNILIAEKFEDEADSEIGGEGGNSEDDASEKETYVTLAQAIESAKKSASGSVIGIALDDDDMGDDDMGDDDIGDDDMGDDDMGDDDMGDDDMGDDDMGDDDMGDDDMSDDDMGDDDMGDDDMGDDDMGDDDMGDDDMGDDDMGDDDMGDDDMGDDDMGDDDMGDDGFNKVKTSADDDTNTDGQTEPAMYIVELLDGDYIHTVMVNATTGEVAKVMEDTQKALDTAITAATKWAALDTVIANALATQAGTLQGMELEIKDAKLVYLVFVDSDTQSFQVTVDAAEGTVLSTESLEMDESMDDEMSDEGGEK